MSSVEMVFDWLKSNFQTQRVPQDTTVLYFALALTLSLTLLVPLLALGAKAVGAPLIFTLPAGLGISLFVYVAVAIVRKQLLSAAAIATIIFATFSANLPLTSGATSYPGTLGPQLMPFQFVLVGLLVLLVVSKSFDLSFTRAELAFGGFVVWSGISATLAGHSVTAFYFTGAMFVAFLALTTMRRVVSHRILSLKHVMLALVIAVTGHATFALIQLIHQGPFGLTFLGETGRSHIWTHMSLPVVGKFGTGVFLSGFTGGNSPMGVLAALTIPLALAGALDNRLRTMWRWGAAGSAALLSFILLTTAKESAYGGVGVGLVVAGVAYLIVGGGRRSKTSTNYGIFGLPLIPLRVSSHSYAIRLKQYVAGLKITLAHPIFGVGGANYPYHAPEYDLPEHLGSKGGGLFPLHNQYIAILAETGLPGFAFFSGAFLLVVKSAWTLLESRPTPLAYGLLAGIGSYAAVIFWSVNVRYTLVVPFWLLAGAVVAASSKTSQGVEA